MQSLSPEEQAQYQNMAPEEKRAFRRERVGR